MTDEDTRHVNVTTNESPDKIGIEDGDRYDGIAIYANSGLGPSFEVRAEDGELVVTEWDDPTNPNTPEEERKPW